MSDRINHRTTFDQYNNIKFIEFFRLEFIPKFLVLKSACNFREDFDSVSETHLDALTSGAHHVDSRAYSYNNLGKGVKLLPLGPEYPIN